MTSKLNLLIVLATTLSPFKYSSAGHDITWDLSIIDNKYLRNILVKCRKYCEPQSINRKYNFKLHMNSVEDYDRRWTKRKKEGVDTLSEWVKAVRSVIQIRLGKLRRPMSTKATFVFKDPEVSETLSTIHDISVVVPADKAPNNIVLICKKHYIDYLNIELGLESS